MKTILETLDSGTQWLQSKGVDTARRDMQLLLCHQLECTKIQLYTRFDQPLDEAQLAPLRDMLKRRGQREPLQHILGTVEFYRREFYTDARALIPRPETEELCEIVLSELHSASPARVLDMGTGSGVIGLTLAAEFGPKSHITCADISTKALELTQKNKQLLGVENVDLIESDSFSQLADQRYDLIVANLPYVPLSDKPTLEAELDYDPALALYSGQDGLDLLREFTQQAPQFLNPNGKIALEIGIHQYQEVEQLLDRAGFSSIHTYSDLSGIQRFPTATWQEAQEPEAPSTEHTPLTD
ncbi:peptide chain release factor N(5)-glutamine methyltransferase [Rubritalea marina]|uniref:peptide chain release factor N(5)-glutamine methyltransferase n=1 Tax=Rubritalea marina TaxID=361055 RepID=UPI00036553C5|nr:peptide chain release factor N(5)-glutamine methyltransferase [Rubritalea marina]